MYYLQAGAFVQHAPYSQHRRADDNMLRVVCVMRHANVCFSLLPAPNLIPIYWGRAGGGSLLCELRAEHPYLNKYTAIRSLKEKS